MAGFKYPSGDLPKQVFEYPIKHSSLFNNRVRVLTVDIHIVAVIVHCIRIELEFGKCWFLWRGENRSTRRKNLSE